MREMNESSNLVPFLKIYSSLKKYILTKDSLLSKSSFNMFFNMLNKMSNMGLNLFHDTVINRKQFRCFLG